MEVPKSFVKYGFIAVVVLLAASVARAWWSDRQHQAEVLALQNQLASKDKTIEVWFQDEARFGQQGTLTRVWAKRGSRPRALRQTKYEWLYVLGAVCPATGQSVGLLSPYLNTQIVNTFFEQFSREVDPEVQVVMVWDQAGFHTSKELKILPNLTILALPAAVCSLCSLLISFISNHTCLSVTI